jgi:hypothetical protein
LAVRVEKRPRRFRAVVVVVVAVVVLALLWLGLQSLGGHSSKQSVRLGIRVSI